MSDSIHISKNESGPPSPFRSKKSKEVKDQIHDANNPDKPYDKSSESLENMKFFRDEVVKDRSDNPGKDREAEGSEPFNNETNMDFRENKKWSEAVVKTFIAGFSNRSPVSQKVDVIEISIRFTQELPGIEEPKAAKDLAPSDSSEPAEEGAETSAIKKHYAETTDKILAEVFGEAWDQFFNPVDYEIKPRVLKVKIRPK